jgi:type IV fimbrial biogenesis protein FimT
MMIVKLEGHKVVLYYKIVIYLKGYCNMNRSILKPYEVDMFRRMKELFLKGSLLKVRKNSMYQQGFTLVELMITLAILAIIISMAGPSFVTMINNNRATGATNDLIASFQLARTEAIKRNETVLIQSKNGTNWSDGHRIQVSSTSEVLRDVDALHSSVTMTSTLPVISYTTDGGVLATTEFTINACESGATRKLNILTLGFSGSTTLTTSQGMCP